MLLEERRIIQGSLHSNRLKRATLGASWDRRQRKEKPLDVPSEEQQVNMAACAFRSDCLEMRTEPDK
jgi:hypothetical protein